MNHVQHDQESGNAMTLLDEPAMLAEFSWNAKKIEAVWLPGDPLHRRYLYEVRVGGAIHPTEIYCATKASVMFLFDFIRSAWMAGHDVSWLFS